MKVESRYIPLKLLVYRTRLFIIISCLLLCTLPVRADKDIKDSEKLGMAIDYFQSGKYHEAMLLLSELNSKYELNPRFKAYLGVCYYYEWDYKNACKHLDGITELLNALSPQERSVYLFCSAESHFMLGEYSSAIPIYEQMINVCHDNEKADAYYRIALCYMQKTNWLAALEYLSSSLAYYERYGYPENKQQRIIQIENMMNGCKGNI